MLLFQSLICLRGYDNGRRFLIISLISYALLLLISPVMSKAVVLIVLLLLVCTPILLAGSMRRIHDAGFATPLAIIPVVTFWVCTLGIALIEHAASYALMVLALLVTAAMTTITNARIPHRRNYCWGYDGPVNLDGSSVQETATDYRERVEPTILTDAPESLHETDISMSQADHSSLVAETRNYAEGTSSNYSEWESKLTNWFEGNRQAVMVAVGVLALVMIVIAVWPLLTSESEIKETPQESKPVLEAKQRIAKIKMPDNFWVMLDQNDALTIAWQGDLLEDGEIWSAITGKGDSDCTNLRFGRNDEYRAMRVEVKNQGDYYADFSPVDSKAIVTAIAKKSRFYLCGFDFSLKGTQALLQTNKKYSRFLQEQE